MFSDAPKPPKPPKRPLSALESLKRDMDFQRPEFGIRKWESYANEIPSFQMRGEPSFSLEGDKKTGFVIKLEVPQLIHNKSHIFDGFISMFERKGTAHSFEASMILTASNIPEKIERMIPFVLNTDGEIDGK